MSTSPLRRLVTMLASTACVTSWLLGATAFGQGNYAWNTSNGNWNTTIANWSGVSPIWTNGTSSNAAFNNGNYTVTLTESITAGSLNFNWNGYDGSTRSPVLAGSTLSVESVYVNGSGLGGSVDGIGQAYNERAQISNTTNVTGNATVQRGMLYVSIGTLNVSGTINSVDAWNVFRADNSTVTATGGINFSAIGSAVELYSGTVTAPFITVGNATWDGSSGLTMGGGVKVVATQATGDFIQVYNNGSAGSRAAAALSTSGLNLDTSSYAVTVATVFNGGGSLTKSGSGTLTLNQSNNYTGGTIVNKGTLVLSAGAWTLNNVGGGGVTVGSGATLRADNSVANQLNGLTLNGGTVEAVNSSGNGDWGNFFLTGNVSASGTSNLNGDIALRASNVDFNVGSDGILNVGGTLHGGYQYGGATVSKSGSGTMVLSGANTYTGATTVNAGTLLATKAAALPGYNAAGRVSVASNATLAVGAGGAGEWSSSEIDSVLGGTTNAFAADSTFGIDVTTGNTFSYANDIGATRAAKGFVKSGAGTLTLAAANSYTGLTTISAGTLALSGSGDIAASSGVNLSASGATLDIAGASGNRTTGDFSGAAGSAVRLGGNTLTAGGASSLTFSGVISGSGGFTKAGSGNLTLDAVQAFTGNARVNEGTLILGGATYFQNAARIDVAADAYLDAGYVGLAVGSAQTLGGYGTVYGNLAFASGATLSPGGSVGQLSGDFGNATLTGGMTYFFEINNAGGTPGGPDGWDLFTTTGAITLAASGSNQILLDIASLAGSVSGTAAGFNPNATYAWKFLVAGSGNAITYQSNWFNVDTSGFQNLPGSPERFYVARGDELGAIGKPVGDTSELYVVYAVVPEPGTLALAGIGLTAAALASRRRRTRRDR